MKHQKWHTLTSLLDLEAAIQESYKQPVVLFKHSVTCGISVSANHTLQQDFDEINEQCAFYYLDLLQHRDISNAIAKQLEITHQSPQIIVVMQGKAIYNASHSSIKVANIAEVIQQHSI